MFKTTDALFLVRTEVVSVAQLLEYCAANLQVVGINPTYTCVSGMLALPRIGSSFHNGESLILKDLSQLCYKQVLGMTSRFMTRYRCI